MKVENVHPEEIEAERTKCENTNEYSETEKMQEQGSLSVLETEDAREDVSSNLISRQQSNPKHENAEKEDAAVQDPDDEHGRLEAAVQEVCDSKQPYTEIMDVVEGNFEEDKSELAITTEEINGTSREMDVSDCQCTESVSLGETNSDQSRELESQVLTPVSVIPGIREIEIAGMVEKTNEQNKTSVQQNVNLQLSSTGEVTKFEQQTAHGDTEANKGREDTSNEADEEGATEGGDLEQDPLKEEIKTADIDSSIGKESIETVNGNDLSFAMTETTQEASPKIQMEENFSALEDSESQNTNVGEATIEVSNQCENVAEAKDFAQHEILDDKVRESYRYVRTFLFCYGSEVLRVGVIFFETGISCQWRHR